MILENAGMYPNVDLEKEGKGINVSYRRGCRYD